MAFQRRPPFRRRPPILRGRPIQRAAIRRLKVAHQLLEEGRWAQAAEHFEQLAAAAESRAMPQTPNLFLQAGRARIENGEQVEGLKHLHHAVDLLGEFDQTQRLQRIRSRVVAELKSHNLEREAMTLDSKIHQILDQKQRSMMTGEVIEPDKQLPTKCPSCGGALRPDEIEWFDNHSAACAYCGSVVRAD